MFKKVFEEKVDDRFLKGYKFDENMSYLDIIKVFQNANIVINNIYANEDADIGMKSFEGNYSLDSFLLKYEEIKNDLASVILNIDNNIKIYINKRKYISISSNENIELDDLLKNEKIL